MDEKYVVIAVDYQSKLQVQKSDPRSWSECESVYFDYMGDYPDHHIIIRPYDTRYMIDCVYDELHGNG